MAKEKYNARKANSQNIDGKKNESQKPDEMLEKLKKIAEEN